MNKAKAENDIREAVESSLSKESWKNIGLHKRAGILVPLFSVYSKRSIGIGDLEDLKTLSDFCNKISNSILQLLPMNETGGTSCPYDSVSFFALEPAYIAIENISTLNAKIKNAVSKLREKFPAGKLHVDYRIKDAKLKLLWEFFEGNSNKELEKFRSENSYWIEDFALFKVLKSRHNGAPWYEWPEKFKNRDKSSLDVFAREYKKEILFQIWLQRQLREQFKSAKEYANKNKVLLKGDLPVLVSRDSADVWAHTEFFKLEFAAGAPPDMYCAKGQRWGMPTYNWENIASDGYRYMKEKLKYAGNFYDILRIDHVVGLFRIWSIPYDEPQENLGLNGFFDPSDESLWEAHGRSILSLMVNSTNMLLCAEDLGIIPPACPDTLREFGIPGNDIQRWVKDWNIRHDFLCPESYRLLSVAALSTHDTTSWTAWWENEAGTVDEGLFKRRCAERGINYDLVQGRLFRQKFLGRLRLRWQEDVSSSDILAGILGKGKEELADFIDVYLNTYKEKEKLWQILGMDGRMKEACDKKLVAAILAFTLSARSIFCIQSLIDWLFLSDMFKGDAYQYRINTPGTVSDKNWSLVIPLALEDLLKHKVCGEIKKMVSAAQR